MAMPGEMEFYAARSGLPATASLTEHQRAYWATTLALSQAAAAQKSTTELEWLFYRVQTLDSQAFYTLNDLRARYFQEKSGMPAGNAAADYMRAFFANPPSAGPTVVDTNYFRNPEGSGPYAWASPAGSWTRTTEVTGGPLPGVPWQKYTAVTAVTATNVDLYVTDFNALGEPVVAGVAFARGIYLICSAAVGAGVGFNNLAQYDAGGGLLSSAGTALAAYPTPATWVRHTPAADVLNASAAFVGMAVRFATLTIPIGGYIGVAAAQLTKAAAVSAFYDGDTVDGGGFLYDWLGTAHNSRSTKSTP